MSFFFFWSHDPVFFGTGFFTPTLSVAHGASMKEFSQDRLALDWLPLSSEGWCLSL